MTMYCGRLNGAWTHIRFWRRDGICRRSNLPVLPSFRDLRRYVPPVGANFDSSLAQMPWICFRPVAGPLYRRVPKYGLHSPARLTIIHVKTITCRPFFGTSGALPSAMKLRIPILLALAAGAFAQDPAPLKLTLRDAVQLALKQNPRVILANLGVAQS